MLSYNDCIYHFKLCVSTGGIDLKSDIIFIYLSICLETFFLYIYM